MKSRKQGGAGPRAVLGLQVAVDDPNSMAMSYSDRKLQNDLLRTSGHPRVPPALCVNWCVHIAARLQGPAEFSACMDTVWWAQ